MKYFVIEAASVNHGDIAKAIYEQDTLDKARMQFHQIRAAALGNDEITYSMACTMDESGAIYDREFSGSTVVPANNPEPSPEPSGE